MRTFSESEIDRAWEQVGSAPEQAIQDLAGNQPLLLGYLGNQFGESLNEEEYATLLFMVMVIHHLVAKHYTLPPFDIEFFETIAEENYSKYEEMGRNRWEACKDYFFQSYYQEDLLAFVEDFTNREDESELSDIGMEIMFVEAKGIIDYYHRSLD